MAAHSGTLFPHDVNVELNTCKQLVETANINNIDVKNEKM
jgi:hypothetical protein